MSQLKKIKLNIKGMHCSSCAMTIDGDLEDYITGVKSSSTNYAKQECVVEFEEEVKLEQIVDQIKKTGYQAEVKADEK